MPETTPTPAPSESPALAPNGWPRELLRGFKAGERAALTDVYRMHAQEVAGLLRHGFAFESGGQRRRFAGYASGFELQDALHETFRRAFEPSARDAYDGLRPYGAYVGTIARNLVLRSFRARETAFPIDTIESGAIESGAIESGVRATVDVGPSPEHAVHEEQVRALVGRFLATLAADEQALVEARFVRGLSQRDAADALGLGRQTIRTKEKTLRTKLLAYLREQGETALVEDVVARVGLPALLGSELVRALLEVTR